MKKILITFLFLGFCAGSFLLPKNSNALWGPWASKYQSVTAENGIVQIPVDKIDDGNAHYFSYKAGDKDIHFFVLKSKDGVIRAAFDACDVCFPERKGYSQSGEYMICNNCGQKFHSSRINVVKGGCNPAPLGRNVQNGKLVIATNAILTGARFF